MIFKFPIRGDALVWYVIFDETFAIRLAPKDVLHVKVRVPRTPVMIQLDLKLRILRASECC